MSRKIRIVGLALVAMLALGAVASASASAAKAPRWKVAGAFLGNGVTEDFLSVSINTIDLSGAGLKISTETCEIVEGSIFGTSAGVSGYAVGYLSCTNVKVVGFESVCSAKTATTTAGTIKTNKLKGTLVYLKKKTTNGAESVGVVFKPETGTEFVNIEVTGAECSLAGKYPVTGEIVAKFEAPGETEVTSTTLEFPTTKVTSYYANGETETATSVSPLKIKANEATFTGKFKTELKSKAKVGVYPG